MKKLDFQKSSTHLLNINYRQFLSLCEAHENIITSFGSSSQCALRSAKCDNGCKKHTKSLHNHQYFQVEQFIKMIEKTRKSYRQFHSLYLYEVIPAHVEKLKMIFKEYIEELMNFDEDTLLLNYFFAKMPTKQVQNLLTQKMKDWQITKLKCEDIKSLEDSYKETLKLTRISSKTKLENILDNNFIRALANKKITSFHPKRIYEIKPDCYLQFINLKHGKSKLSELQNIYIEDPTKELSGICFKFDKLRSQLESQGEIDIDGSVTSIKQIQSPTKQKSNLKSDIEEFTPQLLSFLQKSKTYYMHIILNSQCPNKQKIFWEEIINMLNSKKIRVLSYVVVISINLSKGQLKKMFSQFKFRSVEEDGPNFILEDYDFMNKII